MSKTFTLSLSDEIVRRSEAHPLRQNYATLMAMFRDFYVKQLALTEQSKLTQNDKDALDIVCELYKRDLENAGYPEKEIAEMVAKVRKEELERLLQKVSKSDTL